MGEFRWYLSRKIADLKNLTCKDRYVLKVGYSDNLYMGVEQKMDYEHAACGGPTLTKAENRHFFS